MNDLRYLIAIRRRHIQSPPRRAHGARDEIDLAFPPAFQVEKHAAHGIFMRFHEKRQRDTKKSLFDSPAFFQNFSDVSVLYFFDRHAVFFRYGDHFPRRGNHDFFRFFIFRRLAERHSRCRGNARKRRVQHKF